MTRYLADYIWLGGNNEIRTKSRTLVIDVRYPNIIPTISDIPKWNYDGSSTGQAPSEGDTEVTLVPVYMKAGPFISNKPYERILIVVCATYYADDKPLPNNHYDFANRVFSQKQEEEPWFGLEQEYFIMDKYSCQAIGMNDHFNTSQGQFYCGVGGLNSYGRDMVHQHYVECLRYGLQISGINQEVAVGQWEFQIGPVTGIEAAHQMMIARFLLEITAECHGCYICYDPKPYPEWNGSGCHINFSTKAMRESGGYPVILSAMNKLEAKHIDHIAVYGIDNEKRLTGRHETSSMKKFTWGVGTRNTSVRIGNDTYKNGCGYFEDRRPAANIDPYVTTAMIFKTCVLDEEPIATGHCGMPSQ
jgi:glutamine synthetase